MTQPTCERPFRFSLRTLLIVVAIGALYLGALANPTDFWATTTFVLTMVLVFAASYASIIRRPARRFIQEFAITGCLGTVLLLRSVIAVFDDSGESLNSVVVALCLWTVAIGFVSGLAAEWLWGKR